MSRDIGFLQTRQIGSRERSIAGLLRSGEVFPTGTYHLTGRFYGEDVNLELPYTERDNPYFVGCLDRGA